MRNPQTLPSIARFSICAGVSLPMTTPEPVSNSRSRSSGVFGRTAFGASHTGLPSTSSRRSSAQTLPVPPISTPKKSCFASACDRQRDRILRPVVRAPDLARLHAGEREVGRVAVLAHPQPHELADGLAAQEAAPLDRRSGEVHGMDLVSVENACGLAAVRSSRADHRPPCTIASSTETVPAGPPPQPAGRVPL